jgi:two-component system CheB/CheR fusion protein
MEVHHGLVTLTHLLHERRWLYPDLDRPGMTTNPVPTGTAAAANPFSVVGIGCSAGGLEALQRFFTHVPLNTGMAYVVVQHLSPKHTSALPELLRHYTDLPVVEITDGLHTT